MRAAKQLGKSTAEIKADKYPWLRGYIGWLRFWGYMGNLMGIIGILFGLLLVFGTVEGQEEGWAIMAGSVWTIFSFNFLFVIAELIRLLLDAKNELTELVENTRTN